LFSQMGVAEETSPLCHRGTRNDPFELLNWPGQVMYT
jgi:hypothetical protein